MVRELMGLEFSFAFKDYGSFFFFPRPKRNANFLSYRRYLGDTWFVQFFSLLRSFFSIFIISMKEDPT